MVWASIATATHTTAQSTHLPNSWASKTQHLIQHCLLFRSAGHVVVGASKALDAPPSFLHSLNFFIRCKNGRYCFLGSVPHCFVKSIPFKSVRMTSAVYNKVWCQSKSWMYTPNFTQKLNTHIVLCQGKSIFNTNMIMPIADTLVSLDA